MKFIVICLLLTALSACSANRITTVWKAPPGHQSTFNQILVIAILPDEDSLLRKQIETQTTMHLKDLGYSPVSALEYFGSKGLASMGREGTYIKLCSSGIDFVLTIALTHKTNEKYYDTSTSLFYPGAYYYNRIWNYKNKMDEKNTAPEFFYESILFDLSTLQAQSVFRTNEFDNSEKIKITNELTTLLINKMLKEKMLVRNPYTPLKPF
ncbi:MAG: hypothetical protein ACXWV6_04990 [Chitinophagaceae bacterium]